MQLYCDLENWLFDLSGFDKKKDTETWVAYLQRLKRSYDREEIASKVTVSIVSSSVSLTRTRALVGLPSPPLKPSKIKEADKAGPYIDELRP